jgi:hypothetical protein
VAQRRVDLPTVQSAPDAVARSHSCKLSIFRDITPYTPFRNVAPRLPSIYAAIAIFPGVADSVGTL